MSHATFTENGIASGNGSTNIPQDTKPQVRPWYETMPPSPLLDSPVPFVPTLSSESTTLEKSDPTPEEIVTQLAKIQSEWTFQQRDRRMNRRVS